ncbi:phenoloxidase-activating factor 2 [Drosophila suzukii]|uniref:Phenoloxidase-activating factor 2 n=1 Tax=Drosophila suzukii TaxID=28584 RepID=A0AB39ZZG8_DROSZ
MERFWAVQVLLLACLILGEACSYCVPREECQKEISSSFYPCSISEVCCEVIRSDSQETVTGYGGKRPEKEFPNVDITPWPPKKSNPPPAGTQVQGMSNPNGLGITKYVTDGQSKPGQYPWVVALFNGSQYFAGGSLISAGVVLTAAHRVSFLETEQIFVRAGVWNLEPTTNPFASYVRGVKRIESHDHFDYASGANDLALLFLKTPFELEGHIRTIRLPFANKAIEGLCCTLAGWEWPAKDQGSSSIMKKVELRILGRNTCQNELRRTIDMGNSYTLPQSLICTRGVAGVSLAAGSPLFCSIDEKNPHIYEQIGIVSWGKDCGQSGVLEAYTDVFMFMEWITSRIGT